MLSEPIIGPIKKKKELYVQYTVRCIPSNTNGQQNVQEAFEVTFIEETKGNPFDLPRQSLWLNFLFISPP